MPHKTKAAKYEPLPKRPNRFTVDQENVKVLVETLKPTQIELTVSRKLRDDEKASDFPKTFFDGTSLATWNVARIGVMRLDDLQILGWAIGDLHSYLTEDNPTPAA